MPEPSWQFFIDVGGTFTDVVARPRDGAARTFKLLSTGAIRGTVGEGSTQRIIRDRNRIGEPDAHGGELASTGQVDGKVACRGCQEAS